MTAFVEPLGASARPHRIKRGVVARRCVGTVILLAGALIGLSDVTAFAAGPSTHSVASSPAPALAAIAP